MSVPKPTSLTANPGILLHHDLGASLAVQAAFEIEACGLIIRLLSDMPSKCSHCV